MEFTSSGGESAAVKTMLVGMALIGALMLIGLAAMVSGLIPGDDGERGQLARPAAQAKSF